MTPQELKNSVLQLAIHGKLVEQRPEEGTGEELYRQIQAEKQALIKAGKNKKEKTFPEVTEDEKPFDIPESWMWVRLKSVAAVLYGFPFDSEKFNEIHLGSKLIRIRDVVPADSKTYTTEEASSIYCISNGDMLVGMDGNFNVEFWRGGEAVLNQRVCRITADKSVLLQKWLYFYLPTAFDDISKSVSYVTVKHLSDKHLTSLLIPLPPLAEQKRIVAKIEELLPLVNRYEAAWTKLEAFNKRFPGDMQKSILQMAIQGKLVEQRPEEGTGEDLYQQIQAEKQVLIKAGKIKKEKPLPEITEDEKPFDIPESWMWVRVGSITTLSPKNEADDGKDASFIPMSCVADGYRNEHTFERKKWGRIKKGFTHFCDGDIGVAKITPCFQNRKSVIFENLINGIGAGTTELSIVRIIGETINREFLLWFFKSDYFISNGVKTFTGTAGQQRIHKDYLAQCLFPLPPLAEQKRIVARLDEILPLCERLK